MKVASSSSRTSAGSDESGRRRRIAASAPSYSDRVRTGASARVVRTSASSTTALMHSRYTSSSSVWPPDDRLARGPTLEELERVVDELEAI